MNNKDKISLAEKCGLVLNDFDEEKNPIFIGNERDWKKYEEALEIEKDHEMAMHYENKNSNNGL